MSNQQKANYLAFGLAIGAIVVLIALVLLFQIMTICGCSREDPNRLQTVTAIIATNDHVGTLIAATNTAATAKAPQ